MWWKTTEVYRVALPSQEILDLPKLPIRVVMNVGVFSQSHQRAKDLINDLDAYFRDNRIFSIAFHQVLLNASKEQSHSPAALEAQILESSPVQTGDFVFIEWPKLTDEILVNSDRTAFFSPLAASSKICHVLKSWVLQERKLESVIGSTTSIDGRNLRHKNVPPQPHYDILISVLNPDPELQKLNWNVKLAAERYIAPFLDALSLLSGFTLKSQWKYQVRFLQTSKQVQEETSLGRHFVLPQSQLSQIITSLEKTLGNQVSNKPCIHLVFYAPPCKSAPLRIYSTDGKRASLNGVESFVSSKWGGVVILNPPEATCKASVENSDSFVEIDVDSHEAMETALYLLRKMFDMESNVPILGVNTTQYETIAPRIWEVDAYLRTGCVHLIHTAQSTLVSLIQLLNGISYIVINDQVGREIENSYRKIELAKRALAESRLLTAAQHAKEAYVSAEAAFFDPSLLALLYFPDEQKYAIYIPLFLPAIIPVVLSIFSLRKFFKRKVE